MDRPGLESIALLSDLTEEQLRSLETQCRWHQYSANSQILDQSSEIGDIFFVLEGTVRLVNYTVLGREITLASVRAGEYFGEVAAITGTARAASAVAVDNCRLASLSAESFRRLIGENSKLSLRLLAGLGATVNMLDDRIVDLCTLPAPQRVFAELMRMSEPDTVAPGSWVIRPMRTHAEIASRANTTRETVTRALGQLVTNGIVERVSKSLYIRDRDALAQLARTVVNDGNGGSA